MKLSDFLEEAAIMKEMKHPNLVQVRLRCIFPSLTMLYILASWCMHKGAAFLHCHRVYVAREPIGLPSCGQQVCSLTYLNLQSVTFFLSFYQERDQ